MAAGGWLLPWNSRGIAFLTDLSEESKHRVAVNRCSKLEERCGVCKKLWE